MLFKSYGQIEKCVVQYMIQYCSYIIFVRFQTALHIIKSAYGSECVESDQKAQSCDYFSGYLGYTFRAYIRLFIIQNLLCF